MTILQQLADPGKPAPDKFMPHRCPSFTPELVKWQLDAQVAERESEEVRILPVCSGALSRSCERALHRDGVVEALLHCCQVRVAVQYEIGNYILATVESPLQ